MRRTLFGLVLVIVLACLAIAAVAGDNRGRGPFDDAVLQRVGTPIHNRVVRLLDQDATVTTVGGETTWQSRAFSTSQFNRIGLRFTTTEDSGPVTCRVCWQYQPDDECLDGIPAVTNGQGLVFQFEPGDFGRIDDPEPPNQGDDPSDQRPDGTQRARWSYVGTPTSVDFTDVRGLMARVRCSVPEIVTIGDDPNVEDPELTATLTDVKVLLRRE